MGHGGAAPGDQQVVHRLRNQHAIGQVVEAPGLGDLRELDDDPVGRVRFHRPAVHPDRVLEARAFQDVWLREHVFTDHPARLAYADLGRNVHYVGVLEAGRRAAYELEHLQALAASLDFAVAQLFDVDAADGPAGRILDERRVRGPVFAEFLGTHDG